MRSTVDALPSNPATMPAPMPTVAGTMIWAMQDRGDLERGEPDRLHDADVAVAREDDAADDVRDREGGRGQGEGREGEQDRDVQAGSRVDVDPGFEVAVRARDGVRRQVLGDGCDRRLEVRGRGRRLDAVEHLSRRRRVRIDCRQVRRTHPGRDVRRADRLRDADDGERQDRGPCARPRLRRRDEPRTAALRRLGRWPPGAAGPPAAA